MSQDRLTSYANWIVANKDKKGTPEFEKVASAYKSLKSQTTASFERPEARQEQLPGVRQEPTAYQRARPYVAPFVEGGAGLAGGMIGAGLGPAGAVGGAALGYGIGSEAMRAMDVYLGGEAPRTLPQAASEAIQSASIGGIAELGGPVVVQAVGKGIKAVPKAIGRVADSFSAEKKAANIARNALGEDLPAVMNALKAAPESVSAGQATADINSPVWQSLIDRALRRDPRFLAALEQSQGEVSVNALANLAGGTTATQMRASREAVKKGVKERLIPVLETEMQAANIAGKKLPELEAKAARFGEAAEQKVQDVRRFEAAKERAIEKGTQKYPVKGMPRMPFRYTYEAELADRAEDVSRQAAEASLAFGEAKRFAKAAADSLESYGLKPLKSESITESVNRVLKDPKVAGDRTIELGLKRILKDVQKWTDEGGVVDAWALDAIRKNSINSVVQQLNPAVSKSEQKALAQGVLSKIKPYIVKAVEDAGGTGYGKYLQDYTDEMAEIAKQKLSGEALDLFKNNKDAFVKLVEGESPEVVEKVLGRGNYDIAKELSEQTMSTLRAEASKVIRDAKVKSQVEGGQEALKELLEQNLSRFRLPGYLNQVATTTNAALDSLERKIGKDTMDVLTKAMKTPEGAKDLLSKLPASESARVLKLISSPGDWLVKASKQMPKKGESVAGAEALNQLINADSQKNSMRNR